MKKTKIYAILISVAFIIATLLSLVFLFSVKSIDVEYKLYEQKDVTKIQQTLESYKNKNLIFLDEKEVADSVKFDTGIKVTNVTKKFPNRLEITLLERREVYTLKVEDKYYTLDETGFVMKITDTAENNREKVYLELDGLAVKTTTVGENLRTEDDEFFYAILDMAESVNLSDCIKSVVLENNVEIQEKDAIFKTYTGVDIRIIEPKERGVDKIKKAFEIYDKELNDYYKLFSEIYVVLKNDGDIYAVWKNPNKA